MPDTTARGTLPLLADPENYVACAWDLTVHDAKRAYWLGLFRRHFPSLLEEAVREAAGRGDAQRRADEARDAFFTYLDEVGAEPGRYGRLDILEVCYERERILRRAGFDDPYRLAKARENATALEHLPRRLADLDAMQGPELAAAIIKGVFAGNIFDLGATKTAERFQGGRTVDFSATLTELRDRPWLVDSLDAWLERMRGPAHEQALLFVDNAGPDIVLGMIPLTRYLLQRGTRVILTANSEPSLNDVTHDELMTLIEQVAAVDAVIRDACADGRLRLIASGNNAPLIDMTRLAPKLVATVAAEPVDLLVIEGMGRALESNYHVPFACETLKLAMIKDEGVADALGGEVYDLVMRYEPGRSET